MMNDLKPYISKTEVLNCFHCQWEIFPGSRIFVDLDERSSALFDRQECIEEARKYFPELKVEERVFEYKPNESL